MVHLIIVFKILLLLFFPVQALLDYEKHKREIGEVEFPEVTIPDSTSVENEVVIHLTC